MAGKRAGLDGDRSGLWFEFKRILSELRPRWAIIENVYGLLSSNQGRDFAVVLDGLGECGFAGIAWAVLDSQHFGVAQRRRRVYVVAGPSRRSVEQVLSLCESCGGHPQTRRTQGEEVAGTLRARANDARAADLQTYIPSVSPALAARDYKSTREDVAEPAYVAQMSGTVTQRSGAHTGNSNPIADNLIAHTLRADGFDASEDGTGRGTPLISVRTAQTGSNGWGVNEDGTAYTLDGTSGQAVAGSTVRRLTPTETERLQGFPDGWTDLGNTPDGPRYKAMGNAVSVPVIEYLGRRIMAVHS